MYIYIYIHPYLSLRPPPSLYIYINTSMCIYMCTWRGEMDVLLGRLDAIGARGVGLILLLYIKGFRVKGALCAEVV